MHAGDGHEAESTCQQQQLALNLMFTLGSTATNIASLPIGYTLDRFGPRIASIVGSVLFGCGCLLFGTADKVLLAVPGFDVHIPGFILMAVGG